MTRRSHEYTIAINTRAAASAFEHFQIATGLIAEGSRPAAALHLKAALRAFDRSSKPDGGLRADIQNLLTMVERNIKREVSA